MRTLDNRNNVRKVQIVEPTDIDRNNAKTTLESYLISCSYDNLSQNAFNVLNTFLDENHRQNYMYFDCKKDDKTIILLFMYLTMFNVEFYVQDDGGNGRKAFEFRELIDLLEYNNRNIVANKSFMFYVYKLF